MVTTPLHLATTVLWTTWSKLEPLENSFLLFAYFIAYKLSQLSQSIDR